MELNTTPSLVINFGFILTAIMLTCWWIWVSGKAYANSSPHENSQKKSQKNRQKAVVWAAIIIFIWLALTAFISFQSWARQFDSFPPHALKVFLGLIALTMLLAFLRPGRIISQHTPLWLLIGFQAFRLPLELLIHQAYIENITIIEMTYLGRNFDIVTGLFAFILGVYAYKYTLSNRIILLWNLLGLALLMNVVTIGIFSMPHPIQLIKTDFPNIWITYFPFIWLPSVMVCSALFGHLLIFRYLSAQRKPTIRLKAKLNT